MTAVQIRLNLNDLARQMGAMRIWLDQQRFEPSSFSCRDDDHGVVISLEFKAADQAQAFLKHFNGLANRRSTPDNGADQAPRSLEIGWSQSRVVG
jgi:hypothetical protein